MESSMQEQSRVRKSSPQKMAYADAHEIVSNLCISYPVPWYSVLPFNSNMKGYQKLSNVSKYLFDKFIETPWGA